MKVDVYCSTAAASMTLETKLDESNKGHQLLKKMGWKGEGGLGKEGTGIAEPIKGGEVSIAYTLNSRKKASHSHLFYSIHT